MEPESSVSSPRTGSKDAGPKTILCKKCRRRIDEDDRFCRHCGYRQKKGPAWYYHPVSIAVLGFVVVGPLALPLVWLSPQMSRPAKVLMTTALTLYSIFVGYCFYLVIMYVISAWNQALNPSFG